MDLNLVEETESHVVILLLGLFLLGLLLCLSGGSGVTGSGCGGSSGARADSGTDVGDQLLNVAALEGLGEQAGPVGLNIDLGGLQDGLNLLTLNGISKANKNIKFGQS